MPCLLRAWPDQRIGLSAFQPRVDQWAWIDGHGPLAPETTPPAYKLIWTDQSPSEQECGSFFGVGGAGPRFENSPGPHLSHLANMQVEALTALAALGSICPKQKAAETGGLRR